MENTTAIKQQEMPKKMNKIYLFLPLLFLWITLISFIALILLLHQNNPDVAVYLKVKGMEGARPLLESKDFYRFFAYFSGFITIGFIYQIYLTKVFLRQNKLIEKIQEQK